MITSLIAGYVLAGCAVAMILRIMALEHRSRFSTWVFIIIGWPFALAALLYLMRKYKK
jgi:uncharacterized protein (DUF983 family)